MYFQWDAEISWNQAANGNSRKKYLNIWLELWGQREAY